MFIYPQCDCWNRMFFYWWAFWNIGIQADVSITMSHFLLFTYLNQKNSIILDASKLIFVIQKFILTVRNFFFSLIYSIFIYKITYIFNQLSQSIHYFNLRSHYFFKSISKNLCNQQFFKTQHFFGFYSFIFSIQLFF